MKLFKFSRTGKPLCKVNLFLLLRRTNQRLNKNKPVINFLKNLNIVWAEMSSFLSRHQSPGDTNLGTHTYFNDKNLY